MIELRGLSLDLDDFHLRKVDLSLADGEYGVLLGPTGAGKTVLLECVVGLHRHHAGQVLVDGEDVSRLFPEERQVGYVPQDYALFPNLTVEENLGYGLRARRAPRAEVKTKVEEMLGRLGLKSLARRFPQHLSGGERQRVALGRALATGPRLLLLDEPLSALDENTRADLAGGLRELQRSVKGTFLHVCHHLEEALEVADRIFLVRDGAVVQAGRPDELLHQPRCLFTAEFTRTRNLLRGTAERSGTGSLVRLGGGAVLQAAAPAEGEVVAAFRPEAVEVLAAPVPPRAGELSGRVQRCAMRVAHIELRIDAGAPLVACLGHRELPRLPQPGDPVRLYVAPERIHLFPIG